MAPLTHDEASLLYHVMTWGSTGYPVHKLGRKWVVGPFRSWKGFSICFKTKREAVARFALWHSLALERWREMKAANPHLMMTAVGFRCMDTCKAPACEVGYAY